MIYLDYSTKGEMCQMEDDEEFKDYEGDVFALIEEECYYDDKWREEEGID